MYTVNSTQLQQKVFFVFKAHAASPNQSRNYHLYDISHTELLSHGQTDGGKRFQRTISKLHKEAHQHQKFVPVEYCEKIPSI